ncbi:hypothetical protein GCM10010112_78410 [Actinoplanes lobatus]|uniref:Biotin carboxylase n=1 Tax=Actinoplanes lobatus TaxID=113568 RepID=A0A7W7HN16_9ACTN|nr:ATP-grasp domain-containing protein [Actinoplanes lobatus]MBB4753491.1 biotin carboxylase [Actinoplanes lobatus]GGN91822.1 hypothetical protein GCM10010112_78410 [Actinoplanes lobatus]GIE38024.1 hypothetical protein Alo02nite_09220 [Actinoplanes lobatus]
MGRVRLAVVYDTGAASPLELSLLAARYAPMAVIVGDSPHAAAMMPMFAEFDHVTTLAGADLTAGGTVAGFGGTDVAADGIVTGIGDADLTADGIVTFSERMLVPTAALAERLGLPFHTPAVAALLTDKHRQREALDTAGVTPVRHRPLTDPARWPEAVAHTGLPAVVKPRHGEASRDTHLLRDEAQAAAILPGLPPGAFVLEEYLEGRPEPNFGDYVSVECAAAAGTVTALAVTGKFRLLPPFRETGGFWPSHLSDPDQDEVAALAVAAVEALGVTTGLSHVEIKLTPAGPRIIEVNGRLGGGIAELAHRAAGLDLLDLAARIALGETPPVRRASPDRVYFQHNTVAPEQPCTVTAIHGIAAASATPGVHRIRPFVRPGERLPGGVHTQELDMLTGDAADHAEMIQVLDTALTELVYELDGSRLYSAPRLANAPRLDGTSHVDDASRLANAPRLDDASRVDGASRLDDASRLDGASRLDDASRVDGASCIDGMSRVDSTSHGDGARRASR